jgi:hypothetical protein
MLASRCPMVVRTSENGALSSDSWRTASARLPRAYSINPCRRSSICLDTCMVKSPRVGLHRRCRAWAVEQQVEVGLTGCERISLPPSTTVWILSPSRRAEVDRTACFPLRFLPPHSIAGIPDPFVGLGLWAGQSSRQVAPCALRASCSWNGASSVHLKAINWRMNIASAAVRPPY